MFCKTFVDNNLFDTFKIPAFIIPHIVDSWNNDVPAIYGRFDLWYDGANDPKLIEFNADTPTSIYEAGVVQWHWLQGFDKSKDQFNSIQEKLIAYWKILKEYLREGPLHFSCVKEHLEDLTTVEYMRDCAIQAGLDTKLIFIDDIGWDENNEIFVDMENIQIANMFKLYPWEWIVKEAFGKNILLDKTTWIEPAWKMILSNKGILPVLWELYRGNKYLLKSYFDAPKDLTSYAKKPLLSREGANISLVSKGSSLASSAGPYGEEGFIYQELFELPEFKGNYPMLGSWIIGQEAAGMGVREASGLVTNNTSRFIPHLIEG